jgi:hypothetical protein
VFTLKNHEKAGFHFGRTARCRRHHCSVIGNVAAGFDQSEIDRSMRRSIGLAGLTRIRWRKGAAD